MMTSITIQTGKIRIKRKGTRMSKGIISEVRPSQSITGFAIHAVREPLMAKTVKIIMNCVFDSISHFRFSALNMLASNLSDEDKQFYGIAAILVFLLKVFV